MKHIQKNVISTVDRIESMFSEKFYQVDFDHLAIDKAVAKTIHNDDGFYFEIVKMVMTSQKESQELLDRDDEIITLLNLRHKIKFKIRESEKVKSSISVNGFTKISGIIRDFKTSHYENFEKDSFYRAVILTENEFAVSRYFKIEHLLKIEEITYGSGVLEILVNGIKLHLYLYKDKVSSKNYFIIETVEQCNYESFENLIDEIILSVTYLTGAFLGDSVYFLASKSSNFQRDELVSLKSFFDELKSSYAVIPDLNLHRKLVGNLNDFTTPQVLSKFVETLSNNLIYKRTVLQICQGCDEPHYVAATLYSVALETITTLISPLIEDKNKPIQNKALAKRIRTDLKTALNSHKFEISPETLKKIESDIDRINSLTNKQKLTLPFEYYNYNLSTKEIEAIERRNDFLHGRIPENSNKHDLPLIVGRLLFCVNVLILKYIEFSGYIYYPSTMYQYNNNLPLENDLLVQI